MEVFLANYISVPDFIAIIPTFCVILIILLLTGVIPTATSPSKLTFTIKIKIKLKISYLTLF